MIQRKNLRQEFLTEDELRGQLREQGVVDLAEVEMAHIESDGGVSVIKRDGAQRLKPKKTNSALG